jgi:alanine racemase
MSHLACADEDSEMNRRQLGVFREVAAALPAARLSLANSAGICLGSDYAFDLTRPGLAIYGGIPRREAAGHIGQVMKVEGASRAAAASGGRRQRRLQCDVPRERCRRSSPS